MEIAGSTALVWPGLDRKAGPLLSWARPAPAASNKVIISGDRKTTMAGRMSIVGIVAMAATAGVDAATPSWAHGITQRVSIRPDGVQGNGDSFDAAVSVDGRFVAFSSAASNLVPGDTNGVDDVFVRDLETGAITCVSVGSDGTRGNAFSGDPQLSVDGRFVAFMSAASNLVARDTNGVWDVFIRDRQAGTTRRISVGSKGVQSDQESYQPAISADGRFVAFNSLAGNLVPDDTNDTNDVFVHDRQTGTTRRVSVGARGFQGDRFSEAPALSADGRLVAFRSYASNLVPGDTNGTMDVFVRDRQAGTTRRVSIDSSGAQGNKASNYPSLSANGRFVAFDSDATNLVPGDTNGLVDVFVRDLQKSTTTRASVGAGGVQGDNGSAGTAISASGRFVAFESYAGTLVPGDTNGEGDVFVSNLRTGTLRRVSLGAGGSQGDLYSLGAAISADGRSVAFASAATNLVPRDTNGVVDVFVRVLAP